MNLYDLETLDKQEDIKIDIEDIINNTEDIKELENDIEEEFYTLQGLLDMEEEYSIILDNADKESITENQLRALRTGIYTGIKLANLDPVRTLGIDIESEIIVPSSSLAYDMEGIKDFIKKAWDKFKKALIKANAFFRKMFVKFLNMVSFRKGTIEKLIEDVEDASSIKEVIKNKNLATKFGFINIYNKKSSKEVSLNNYKELINIVTHKDYAKNLKIALNNLKKRTKDIKDGNTILHTVGEHLFKGVTDGLMSLGKGLSGIKNNKYVIGMVSGYSGSEVKCFVLTKNGNVDRMSLKIPVSPNTIKDIKQNNIISVLKSAEKANEDFKYIVNETFDIVDDVMDIADSFEDVLNGLDDLGANSENKLKSFKENKKAIQSMIGGMPWFAYHSTIALYKEIGYVISLAKEVLKTKD